MAPSYASSFCFVILLCSAAAEAIDGGFTVELIPRDSPKSPFYNPLETPFQRVGKAMRRSIARFAGLRSNAAGAPSADITNSGGEFLVNITIGTPPVQIVAIADTGSDLIWTQCKPCSSCFEQEAPLFDPSKSRTYAIVPCNSAKCQVYDQTSCSSRGSACRYQASYGDQSYTNGNIATDIIGLGSSSGTSIKFPGAVFGCGYDNAGTFDTHTSGIVGLGGGDSSLVSQIRRSSGGKFSYCLVPISSTSQSSSKLSFGANAQVEGGGTVSTPLIKKSQKTFYYLTLEGLSINGKKFEVSGSSGRGTDKGNIIIDSGTTLTYLPPDLYKRIEPAVSAAIHLPVAKDPEGFLKLCYKSSGEFKGAPNITVHFTGADVKLNWYNAFVNIEEDISCFGFVPSSFDLSIYGNVAQSNFLIGYDLTAAKLSFKPSDCTSH
ncbi:hypothetical protein MLD38_019175 [Melastoma candidum]|uniref:Uncharacterized protein n=1 Tax=Melastoma candidum TaxID=119954 RepID=A0ACB9QW56_9MYRT|nr:hypothetical protein MLD38_019175 [Melastoma candidum]